MPEIGERCVENFESYAGHASYKITQLPPQDGHPQIEIVIPMGFDITDEGMTSHQMEQKVSACLAYVRPYLKGPHGEQVILRLATAKEKKPREFLFFISENKRLHPKFVEVVKGTIREDSAKYSQSTVCSTILHEVLHLLGLVDEYNNNDKVLDPTCPKCRVKGPRDSIMNQSAEALEKALAHCLVEKFVLSCTDDPKNHTKEIAAFYKGANTPSKLPTLSGCKFEKSSIPDEIRAASPEGECVSRYEISTWGDHGGVTLLSVSTPQPQQSLLKRAHFNKIVYPHCDLINATYNNCARFAYDHKIVDCVKDIPKECQSTDWVE